MPAPANESRFLAALEAFDAENAQDPTSIEVDGVLMPHELFYAKFLYHWVLRLQPNASEELLLAARCQHLRRWTIPRGSFEMNRVGYLRWRTRLKEFHAETSAKILRDLGYPEETIQKVSLLNLKKNLGTDPDCAVLEDALCLMTLQYQLTDLMRTTPRDRLIEILRKTWNKMTAAGHAAALTIQFEEEESNLIKEALGT